MYFRDLFLRRGRGGEKKERRERRRDGENDLGIRGYFL